MRYSAPFSKGEDMLMKRLLFGEFGSTRDFKDSPEVE